MAMDEEEELFQSEDELRPIIVSCLCQYPMCAQCPPSLFVCSRPAAAFFQVGPAALLASNFSDILGHISELVFGTSKINPR